MMGSDNVSNWNDTLESVSVADELRNAYMHLATKQDWEHLKKMKNLDSAADANKPNYFLIPEDISEIMNIKYDISERTTLSPSGADMKMTDIYYMEPDSFISMCQGRNASAANVLVVKDSSTDNVYLPILKDKNPEYWTSFDNKYIIFDSYNRTVEGAFVGSAEANQYSMKPEKTQVYAIVAPTWTESNSFTPDMPVQLFPLLVYEAAQACMEHLSKDKSDIIDRRATDMRNLMKTRQIRHNGKTKKGFGRR